MGTTAHGLPYPEPTDPIADGADAIRALAEAVDTNAVLRFPTAAACKAATAPDGTFAVITGEGGWGLIHRSGGVWNAERVITNSATTSATGAMFLAAAAFGFATLTMVQVETRKTFPAAGASTPVSWTSIDAGNLQATIMCSTSAGVAVTNTSVQYAARIRGVL